MINSDLLLTPIFNAFGTDAEMYLVDDSTVQIRAIDRTRGVPVTQNGVETGTLTPAAAVRSTDLAGLSLTLADLRNALLTMNSKQWTVMAAAPVPGPDGEDAGQVILFLSEYEEPPEPPPVEGEE